MRALFGVVSLLVVLAIVGFIAARQLRATGPAIGAALPPSSTTASAPATVREHSRQLQQQVQSDVVKALEAGAAARRDEAGK